MSDDLTNVALLIAYDGSGYHGWQRHHGKPTIQGTLEDAIHEAFGIHVAVAGSGRTDRGAHASGQVATASLPASLSEDAIAAAVNAALPADVTIEAARRVAPDFHARESALGKRYRYVLWVDAPVPPERERRVWTVRGPLDVEAMAQAMDVLVGEHDFATFVTRSRTSRSSTVRTMTRAALSADLPMIELTLEANGFLYKMVRNLVRAVVKVGESRSSPRDLARMLAARDRHAAPGTAPASGLFLDAVLYDPPLFSVDVRP